MQYNGRLENIEIIYDLQGKMDIIEDNLSRYGVCVLFCGIEK